MPVGLLRMSSGSTASHTASMRITATARAPRPRSLPPRNAGQVIVIVVAPRRNWISMSPARVGAGAFVSASATNSCSSGNIQSAKLGSIQAVVTGVAARAVALHPRGLGRAILATLAKPIRSGMFQIIVAAALKEHLRLRGKPELLKRHAVAPSQEPENMSLAAR